MMSREDLVQDNLGLVHSCCKRFKGRGIDYDDLFQAGCIGLVKAIDNFDESRGLMLSTYAVPVILGEIRRLFREGGSIKVSRPLKELALKASRESEIMSKELGRTPTVSELATKLNVSPEEAAEALCASQPAVSLTFEDEGEVSEIDLAVDDETGKLCENLALNDAIHRLPENDRALITLRYFGEHTQTQTAVILGMTQVQVSRKEKAILKEIRKFLECG